MSVQLVVEGVALELDALGRDGVALAELAVDGRVDIETSCRSAACGTCMVRVVEGGELLSPIGPDERDLLELLADTEEHRLGCQARILPTARGRCVLRHAD